MRRLRHTVLYYHPMTLQVGSTPDTNSIRDINQQRAKLKREAPLVPLSLPLLLPSPALLLFRRRGFISKNEGARVFVCASFSRTQRRTGKYNLTDSAEGRGQERWQLSVVPFEEATYHPQTPNPY